MGMHMVSALFVAIKRAPLCFEALRDDCELRVSVR